MVEFTVGAIIGFVMGALATCYIWGAGLILLLAGSGWFSGAATVGWILFGIGAVAAGFVGLLFGGSIWAALTD